ncbi:MAG: methyltransferase type 11 [Dehalococcoidia bacterium]|nr:methyltransferase type 11 [Dehalococcoidia bacterium]
MLGQRPGKGAFPETLKAAAPPVVAAHLRELPVHRALIRTVECLLMRSVDLPRPLLDVGCGDGHFGEVALAPAGLVDSGFDPDLAKVHEAAERGVYRLPLAASATRLPYADASFASVVSNCVLEHIEDLDGALGEISRVLRPGGQLAITVPTHRFARTLFWPRVLRRLGRHDAADAYGRWFNRISLHYHTLTPEGWTARLAQHGLAVEQMRDYLGPRAMGFFDLSHYYGAPTLVTKRLTGRWLWRRNGPSLPWERWIAARLVDFCGEVDRGDGAYVFCVARRVGTITKHKSSRGGESPDS